mmetsp:Transcript_2353/g.5410  ORF Transcript_2353/g.5410 Transcript_2353/m.5410 type:complete len:214 (+) Transcript_2353:362-1003(+)
MSSTGPALLRSSRSLCRPIRRPLIASDSASRRSNSSASKMRAVTGTLTTWALSLISTSCSIFAGCSAAISTAIRVAMPGAKGFGSYFMRTKSLFMGMTLNLVTSTSRFRRKMIMRYMEPTRKGPKRHAPGVTSTNFWLSPSPCMVLVSFQCSSAPPATPKSLRISEAPISAVRPMAWVPVFRTALTLGAFVAFFLCATLEVRTLRSVGPSTST